jgi:hypothetical protein
MKVCLLCGNDDGIKHPDGTKYICSDCVQLMLSTDTESARSAYANTGNPEKREALELFYGMEELTYDYNQSNIHGEAVVRISRMQKSTDRLLEAKSGLAVHKGIQHG